MTSIKLSKADKEQVIPLIQEYLKEELDCEAGSFEAEFLLDFFSEKIGGYMYNQALSDVHALLNNHLDVLSESIYTLEKPVSNDNRK